MGFAVLKLHHLAGNVLIQSLDDANESTQTPFFAEIKFIP